LAALQAELQELQRQVGSLPSEQEKKQRSDRRLDSATCTV
jgi:hypothetical protein